MSKKWWFWTIAALFCVGMLSGCGEEKKEASPQEKKDAFLNWEIEITLIKAHSDANIETYHETMAAFSENSTNFFVARAKVDALKSDFSSLRCAMFYIDPPEVLSEEHREKLRKVESDLGASLYRREQALEKALELFDAPRPGLVTEIQNNFERSLHLMVSGIAKLTEVKSELGLAAEE